MTLNSFKYFPFALKLNRPFQTSTQTMTGRNGFILSISDELGNTSFGECSPLPGFSLETIEDAERILRGLQYQIIGFSAEDNINSLADLLSEFHLVPSLQFALEQAIIGLMIKRNKNFIKDFFVNVKSEFEVNAVIGFGEEENILNRINEKIKKGYSTFKIKIGRDDFDLDFKLIQSVRAEYGDSIKIRLDANRKWSFENAKSYLDRLSLFHVEYIEEPCNNLTGNLQLAQTSIIPIALDESLSSIEVAYKVINESNINFIVLKPMIYGGIISSIRIIQEAGKKNKNVIISSSFESALGKSALVLLAASINHSFAHGLDTSEYFKQDICKDPFEVKNGKIFCDSKNYPPQFDFVLP
jgi:o-succinylbenzoate synthase